MTEKRLALHNAVAVFERLDDAMSAVEALREAGFDADELSLLSRTHGMAPGSGQVREQPTISGGGVGKAALLGLNLFTVVGAVVGAITGVVLWNVVGFGPLWANVVVVGVIGAWFGHLPGALLGAEAGARKRQMWTQTLEPHLTKVEEGLVLVGVHTNDASRVELAGERLHDLEPLQMERLGAEEAFDPPGTVASFWDQTIPTSHPQRVGGELGRKQADTRVGVDERRTPEDDENAGDDAT